MKQLLMYGQSYFYLLIYFFNVLTLPAHACSDSSKSSMVKANMHALQTMLETYAIDWKGRYPRSIHELIREAKEAKTGHYWRDFHNPITHTTGLFFSVTEMNPSTSNYYLSDTTQENFLGIQLQFKGWFRCEYSRSHEGSIQTPGIVIYEYLSDQHYAIYGVDQNGMFIQDRAQNFILSNS